MIRNKGLEYLISLKLGATSTSFHFPYEVRNALNSCFISSTFFTGSQNCGPYFFHQLNTVEKEGLLNGSSVLQYFLPFFFSLCPGNEPGSKWAISSRSVWILVTNNSSSSLSYLSFFFLLLVSFFLVLFLLLLRDNVKSKNQWPKEIKFYSPVFLGGIIIKARLHLEDCLHRLRLCPGIKGRMHLYKLLFYGGKAGPGSKRVQVCPRPW